MSDAVSALAGASFDGAVRIEEAGLRGIITLKGDLNDAGLRGIACDIAGVDFPGQGGAHVDGERGLCWMAPDEVMLLTAHSAVPDAMVRIDTALNESHHLAVNVSDARALFHVAGFGAREVLAKLTPADLRPASFGPGQIRRTRLAQVPAAFWMPDEDAFEVVCFRSVAGYVFDLLSNAARPGTLPEHF